MQGTQVQSLVGNTDFPHAVGKLSPHTTTREDCMLEQRPSTAKSFKIK